MNMDRLSPDELKKVLVDSGYIEQAEFNAAVKSAQEIGKSIADTLIFRGLISEDALNKLIAEYLRVPYANLSKVSIPKEVLELVPEKIARTYRIIPYEKHDNALKVAMDDPTNFEALEFARRQTDMVVEPHYASSADIGRALGQYKRDIKHDFEDVIKENLDQAKITDKDDLVKAAEKLPIVKILDTIIGYSIAERASDVHIETQGEDVIVRFRIDGILHDIVKLPRAVEAALVARIKILSELKIDEHRIPQDGRYKFSINDEVIALRISIIPGFYGENVVMRILHETQRPLSLEELGLTGENLNIIKSNITKPHGMILVTGPTGSGKTTTLYSILNILNTIEVKICTIEDPVEYGINRVSQIQVNSKTGVTFATGLRSLLRHDPDIIMVGEIRDEETAEIAVHSALTGHLVLSTLHTNTAAGAIPRFLDMGVEDFLLASTVNVIIAQRLVRKICSSCVVLYKPDKKLITRLEEDLQTEIGNMKFYKGEGCDKCGGKGYKGRLGIFEVLSVSSKLRELVTSKASSDQIEAQATKDGMITMIKDGLNKISAGQTTIEEVLRVVRES